MKRTFLLSVLIPVFGATGLGLYYANNPSKWYANYIHIPFASENIELVEDLKKSQESGYSPSLAAYNSHNTKGVKEHWDSYDLRTYYPDYYQVRNKPINADRGQERIHIIQDYSIKIQTSCGSGTGWFLDYVLPTGSQKYPTKWFVATNAHVIDQISFWDNPYQQLLPQPRWRGCLRRGEYKTPVFLFKEKTKQISQTTDTKELVNFVPELWSKVSHYSIGNTYAYNASEPKAWGNSTEPEYLYFVEEDVKLFYAPMNYIGLNPRGLGYKWTKTNYYKDFAVLEIDFKNEETAKLITRDFYGKYDRTNGSLKNKALDFFSEELMLKKTSDQLFDEKVDYFIAGYASNVPDKYRSYGNYSPVRQGASRLTYLNHRLSSVDEHEIKNKDNQPIIGHVDVGQIDETFRYGNKTSIYWNGIPYNNWGYNYLLDNSILGAGASGSLATDENGHVIGLYRMYDASDKQGYVEPIRSKGLYENGKIIFPKYDLIEGDVGQISSFKQQVSKYYLSRGQKTSLSEFRKWT
ncbi:MIP family Ig-specific serine endopeptidase [Candidatus Mycoplasma haematohominis]|uniref:MIP family Ig-specific serine endopeptidase n=1 Tax=Candidatus Mycoplasma haematohominis TaxID=1494318 RepID=UPI001C0A73D0|nr:DUF31 family protein [Candidatus Mycoplasma haemohominis]